MELTASWEINKQDSKEYEGHIHSLKHNRTGSGMTSNTIGNFHRLQKCLWPHAPREPLEHHYSQLWNPLNDNKKLRMIQILYEVCNVRYRQTIQRNGSM